MLRQDENKAQQILSSAKVSNNCAGQLILMRGKRTVCARFSLANPKPKVLACAVICTNLDESRVQRVLSLPWRTLRRGCKIASHFGILPNTKSLSVCVSVGSARFAERCYVGRAFQNSAKLTEPTFLKELHTNLRPINRNQPRLVLIFVEENVQSRLVAYRSPRAAFKAEELCGRSVDRSFTAKFK